MFRLVPWSHGELVARNQDLCHQLWTSFHCPNLPSVLNRGGEVRQDWGNQRRVAILILGTWREKPALCSTHGGLLNGYHKTWESSTCQTAGTESSQWDGSVPPDGRCQEGCSYSGVQTAAAPSPQLCPQLPPATPGLTDVASETWDFWAKQSGQRESAPYRKEHDLILSQILVNA